MINEDQQRIEDMLNEGTMAGCITGVVDTLDIFKDTPNLFLEDSPQDLLYRHATKLTASGATYINRAA
jgi:hypothetical protein